MMRRLLPAWVCGALLLSLAWCASALARDTVIEGKDNWLFAGWQSLTARDAEAEKSSIQLIADVDRLLARRNVKLLVMIIPIKARYYAARLPDGLSLSEQVLRRYDLVLGELRSASVTTLDVREPLRDVIGSKQDVFYRADFHWTSAAAEATADRLADLITREAPLPGKAGTGMRLGDWITDRHMGDLAANFLSPDRKRAIGLDSYVVRKAVTEETGLLDGEPAPVALVGNSFVQPYFGFPQRLLNRIDRPVSLKWNPGDVSPWATLLQYLESPEFRTARLRYIVWQFDEGQLKSGPGAVGDWIPQSVISPSNWLMRVGQAVRDN